ncbi:MAG: exo-alpha-sialidase [Clostridia bacterium]|nr:exo-alpha-sialidase [Clostridia bacterium]
MRLNRKLLALFLTFSILIGSIPAVFADAASPSTPAAIDENFDSMTVGQEPNGWTVEPTDRTDASVKTVDAPQKSQGDYAMRIEDNSTEYQNPSRATKTFAPTADVELCFDYYLESVQGANAFALSKNGIATNDKRVNIGIFPNDDGTGTLKYYSKSQSKWVSTPKTDMQKETWYSFRIVTKANSDLADLYLDGKKVCSIWSDRSIDTVDRVVFHTNNKASIGDVFLIDNVKVFGPATAIDYPVATCNGGKFGFTVTLSNLSNLKFALMSNDAYGFYIAANEDGTLCYRRDDRWIEFSTAGAVCTNEELQIVFDLPDARNVDYVRVYVNNIYVGMAIYTNKCSTVTAMRFETEGDVRISNVWSGASDGIVQMPSRTESAPEIYVPEVIPSTPLIRSLDYDPTLGKMSVHNAGGFVDTNTNSIGVDLGYKQSINAIRLYDSDAEVTSRANHFTLWQSDDNLNWTEISGFQFNRIIEDKKCQVLFEFSGVEARYVKVHTTKYEEEASIYLSEFTTCIRAERRIARQWKMAGIAMQKENDLSPTVTPMTQVLVQNPFSIQKGDSVGIWFGIHSEVEAIELYGNGLDNLGKNDFALYYSNDNVTYTKIENVTLSRGDSTYRLTFDSVKCGYLKLYAAVDMNISISSVAEGLVAYSSQEVSNGYFMQSELRGADGDFYTLPDGTLVAAYNGFASKVGSSGGTDASDATLNIITSLDGGYAWGEEQVMLEKQPGSLNLLNPTFIWLANGDLGLIYCEKEEAEVCNIYIRRSTDNGLTWGDAQRITDAPQGYTILPSGHRVLRLSTGRILLPVAYSATVNDVYGSDRAIGYVWYSDDEGYTWHRSLDALTLPHAALEPSVAELQNGDILLSLRTREERVIYQSISTDGGLTWAQPTKTAIQSPSATNTVMTLPATGDIALFWNNDFSTKGDERRPLTVAISTDNGLTYHNIRSLVDCDYPTPWPSVAFYGRSVLLMHGNETHVRVFDIATLYYTTSGKVTTADLPLAPTPTAVWDEATGWLTNVSNSMQYSLDGGKTWSFAGGTSVQIELNGMAATEIWVKDMGTATTAPSDVQKILLAQEEPTPPPVDEPEISSPEEETSTPEEEVSTPEENPTLPNDSLEQSKKHTTNIGTVAAIVIGAIIAVGAIGIVTYALIKKKRKI